jgi:hypothetical protein
MYFSFSSSGKWSFSDGRKESKGLGTFCHAFKKGNTFYFKLVSPSKFLVSI